MRIGKLDNKELKENIFGVLKRRRKEVKISSSLAQDCASFKIAETALISTDPITGASENSGKLAIQINANDIYAAGGEPVLAVLTVLAPVNTAAGDIKKVLVDAEKEAERQNIEIVGGHTEFTDAVSRLVVSVTVIGKTDRHITGNSAMVGDAIILTKYAGIEGTVVLVSDMEEKAREILTSEELSEAKTLACEISIAKEASVARKFKINAMHDITEGGVFGAVCEMAEAAHIGADVFAEKIPLLPVTKKLCDGLGIDPYRLISSGSLLISVPKAEKESLLSALLEGGINAAEIGVFTDGACRAVFAEGESLLSVTGDELLEYKLRNK